MKNWGVSFSSREPKAQKVSLQDGHALASTCPSSIISKIFSSETAWSIKAKLQVKHPYEAEMKFYINGPPGHVTKMAAKAINSKNHLQIRKAYDFETWHEASGRGALQRYINRDPGMAVTYFMPRSI